MDNQTPAEGIIDVNATIVTDDPSLPVAAKVERIDVKANLAVFDPVKAALAELAVIIENTPYDINTTAGEAIARGLRTRCVKLRTGTAELYKERNGPLLELGREMRRVVAEIEAGIAPHETKLDQDINQKERIREEERMRKVAIEVARVQSIRDRITAVAGAPARAALMDSAGVFDLLAELRALDAASFEEFAEEFTTLSAAVESQLVNMLEASIAREEESARLEQAAIDLEKERAAHAARVALQEKINQIKSYPVQAIDMTVAEIQYVLDVRQRPTEEKFGDLLDEAIRAFDGATIQLNSLLAAKLDAALALAKQQEAAEAAAAQRLRDEQAAAQRQLDAEAASARAAKLLKDQQDAFEAERQAALAQQKEAQAAINADRKELEGKARALELALAPPIEPTSALTEEVKGPDARAPSPAPVCGPDTVRTLADAMAQEDAENFEHPGDLAIARVVADHFNVDVEVAIDWLGSWSCSTANDELATSREEIPA